MVITIIDIVTIIHLCPHLPLILFGDSQSFQRRLLDGAARTHFQIPLYQVSDIDDTFLDGFWQF